MKRKQVSDGEMREALPETGRSEGTLPSHLREARSAAAGRGGSDSPRGRENDDVRPHQARRDSRREDRQAHPHPPGRPGALRPGPAAGVSGYRRDPRSDDR